MSYHLNVTLGTVNFNNFVHVTAAKVSSPGSVVWEAWYPTPLTNFAFIIPGLDPENYLVSYYDAPNNTALGSIRMQLIGNALRNEFIYERRFYKVGGPGTYDPAVNTNVITDPYFVNKTVVGVFKEAFRPLIDNTEWDMTTTVVTTPGDSLTILLAQTFDENEVVCVDLRLSAGTTGSSSGGSLYSGRVDVTDAIYSVLQADKNKRHRLIGTMATQVLTLPAISGLSQDSMYLFDNTLGGVALQVKILTNGTDRIVFNGFNTADLNFAEFWVSKGETLMIAVIDDNWEVILPYLGTKVGKRFSAKFKDHPGIVLENGQIGADALDGDLIPRLWWWLNEVLPDTHIIVDDTVVNTSYVHPAGKEGYWVMHSTLKKFRTPNTQNLSERGLKNFSTYGGDTTNRPNDYPGGVQNGKLLKHRHFTMVPLTVSGGSGPGINSSLVTQNDSGPGDFKYIAFANAAEPSVSRTSQSDGAAGTGDDENIVKNFGVIYAVEI